MIAYTVETSGLSFIIRAAVSIKFGVAMIGSFGDCDGGGGGGGDGGGPGLVCKLFKVS